MKFRVSLKAAIVSLILVIFISAIIIFSNLGNFAEKTVNELLSSIKLPNSLSITFDSVDKQFLNSIKLNNVQIKLDNQNILSVEKIVLSASIQDLIDHYFSGFDTYDISLYNPTISVNQKQIEKILKLVNDLSKPKELNEEKQEYLITKTTVYDKYQETVFNNAKKQASVEKKKESDLLQRTGFRINTIKLNGEVEYSDIWAKLENLDAIFTIEVNFEGFALDFKASSIQAKAKDQEIKITDAECKLFDDLDIFLLANSLELKNIASVGELVIATNINEILENNKINAQIELNNLKAFNAELGNINALGNFDLNTNDFDLIFNSSSLSYNDLADVSIAGFDGDLKGNIDSEVDYSLALSSVEGLYEGKDLAIQTLLLNGQADLNDSSLYSSINLLGLDTSGYEDFKIGKTHVNQLGANVNLNKNYVQAEFYSDIETFVDMKAFENTTADFQGDLLYYFDSKDLSVDLSATELKAKSITDPLNFSASLENEVVNFEANALNTVYVKADYSLVNQNGNLNLRLVDFTPNKYKFLTENYLTSVKNFISSDTELDLFLSASLNSLNDLNFITNFDLALRNVIFADNKYNCTLSFNGGYKDSQVEVKQLLFSTGEYRVDYDGTIKTDFIQFASTGQGSLPVGTFTLRRSIDASKIASLSLSSQANSTYSYSLLLENYPQFSFNGKLTSLNFDFITDLTLGFGDVSYDLRLDLDFANMRFRLDTKNLFINSSYTDQRISINAKADDFDLMIPGGRNHKLSFDFGTIVRTDSSIFNSSIRNFYIGDTFISNLGFDCSINNQSIRFTNVVASNIDQDPYKGTITINFGDIQNILNKDFSKLSFFINLQNTSEKKLRLSYEDQLYSLTISDYDLSRLKIGQGTLNLNVLGRLNENGYASFSYENQIQTTSFDVIIGKDGIKIDRFISSLLGGQIVNTLTQFDRNTQEIEVDLIFSKLNKFNGRDSLFKGRASLQMDASPISKFISEIKLMNLLEGFDFKGLFSSLSAYLSISEIAIGRFSFERDLIKVGFDGQNIIADGSLIDVSYNPQTFDFSAEINKDFGLGIRAIGKLGNDLDLHLDQIHFPLPIIYDLTDYCNEYYPTSGILTGNVELVSIDDEINAFGTLTADELAMKVLFVPETTLTMANPIITLTGRDAYSPYQRVAILNEKTLERDYGWVSTYLSLDLSHFNFQLDAKTDSNNFCPVGVPLISQNINIAGKATNAHFCLRIQGYDVYIDAEGDIVDGVVDFDLESHNIPQWFLDYIPSGSYNYFINLDLNLKQNNKLYYPSQVNPLLNVTISDNQRVNISINTRTDKIDVLGELGIKSGEVYYFQKNFLVNEGKLDFSKNPLNTEDLNIQIDLRARMRDYDADGNAVDIYFNLQNSSLSNFEPYFTSTPALSQEEILQRLGQSIIPTAAFQAPTVSSLAQVTVGAVQAISRLGLINTGESNFGLDSIIKNSLNLDIFSIRTNLLQNLVLEFMPGANISQNLTPMARYLNGTSIYLGKYLTDNLLLQGSFVLRANDRPGINHSSFLSQDLKMDIELSLQFENPMGTFSIFTQPQELSIFNLFDTMGFSVTKTIEF